MLEICLKSAIKAYSLQAYSEPSQKFKAGVPPSKEIGFICFKKSPLFQLLRENQLVFP